MKCFLHNSSDAVGICKSCNKAICTDCAIDTGRGLACCVACEQEVNDINQIVDKSKQIYSIGTKSALPPTGLLVFGFFGLMFTAFGIYNSLHRNMIDYLTLAMGLGFIVITIISYIKTRKLNLNC